MNRPSEPTVRHRLSNNRRSTITILYAITSLACSDKCDATCLDALDVIVIVDNSGSMACGIDARPDQTCDESVPNSKMSLLQRSVAQLISYLETEGGIAASGNYDDIDVSGAHELGIVTFAYDTAGKSGEASLVSAPGELDGRDLRNVVDNLEPRTATPLYGAISIASDVLSRTFRPKAKQVTVIATDGNPTDADVFDEVERDSIVSGLKAVADEIYSIKIGSSADNAAFMRTLAKPDASRFFEVTSDVDAERILPKIAEVACKN